MKNNKISIRMAISQLVVNMRLWLKRLMVMISSLWSKKRFFYLLIVLFMFTLGYKLGQGSTEVKQPQSQLTKEERIRRIEEQRAKCLAEGATVSVTKSPSISGTPSTIATGNLSKVPTTNSSSTAITFGGIIETLSTQLMVVKNSKGEKKSFVITEGSVFVSKVGKTGAFADFKVGDEVMIFGTIKDEKVLLVRAKEM